MGATPKDASAITKILLSNETDRFFRLQLGTIDSSVLCGGIEASIEESMQRNGVVYMIAKDAESGEVVSFAQWDLPRNETEVVIDQSPVVSLDILVHV